jgi:hypothetical protein
VNVAITWSPFDKFPRISNGSYSSTTSTNPLIPFPPWPFNLPV